MQEWYELLCIPMYSTQTPKVLQPTLTLLLVFSKTKFWLLPVLHICDLVCVDCTVPCTFLSFSPVQHYSIEYAVTSRRQLYSTVVCKKGQVSRSRRRCAQKSESVDADGAERAVGRDMRRGSRHAAALSLHP